MELALEPSVFGTASFAGAAIARDALGRQRCAALRGDRKTRAFQGGAGAVGVPTSGPRCLRWGRIGPSFALFSAVAPKQKRARWGDGENRMHLGAEVLALLAP